MEPARPDTHIKVLNSVTKTLIDSCKGYETCAEIADDNYTLQNEFRRRKAERENLVSEFQRQVRVFGGEPEDFGSATGAVHRGFTRFSSTFQNDEFAAISALDDGEELLAEKVEDRLTDYDLDPVTSNLLQKAHQSARSAERFADML